MITHLKHLLPYILRFPTNFVVFPWYNIPDNSHTALPEILCHNNSIRVLIHWIQIRFKRIWFCKPLMLSELQDAVQNYSVKNKFSYGLSHQQVCSTIFWCSVNMLSYFFYGGKTLLLKKAICLATDLRVLLLYRLQSFSICFLHRTGCSFLRIQDYKMISQGTLRLLLWLK